MPKADYTFVLDEDRDLFACFGRTAKYIYDEEEWKPIKDPNEFEDMFDLYGKIKYISKEEAMKITNNLYPKDYYIVHKRVYMTEEAINQELLELMKNRKYSTNTKENVMKSDLDLRVMVLEWLIKSPNLHELTIGMLINDLK